MSLKILLADDSMTAQRMGQKILEGAGYEVVPVSNGAAALKKLPDHKPDLLILDVYMPGYTGLEVCERVKNAPETARIPVILTVGKLEPFRAEEGNRVKADGVIVKPFEPTDLLSVVKKLEEKRAAVAPAAHIRPVGQEIAYQEFKDTPCDEWKLGTELQPASGEENLSVVSVPEEMAAAPALGLEDFAMEETASAIASAPEMTMAAAAASAPSFEIAPLEPAPALESTALDVMPAVEPSSAEMAVLAAATPTFEIAPVEPALATEQSTVSDVMPAVASPAEMAVPEPTAAVRDESALAEPAMVEPAVAAEPALEPLSFELPVPVETAPEPVAETSVLEPVPELELAPPDRAVEPAQEVLEPLGELTATAPIEPVAEAAAMIEPELEPISAPAADVAVELSGEGDIILAAPAEPAEILPDLEPPILLPEEPPPVLQECAVPADVQQPATEFPAALGGASLELATVAVAPEAPAPMETLVIEPVIEEEVAPVPPMEVAAAPPAPALEVLAVLEEAPLEAAPLVEIPVIETAAPVQFEPAAALEMIEVETAPPVPPAPLTGIDLELPKEPEAAIPEQPELAAAVQASELPEPVALPEPTLMIDKSVVEELVNRVLERLKPQLIAEISRELQGERDDL